MAQLALRFLGPLPTGSLPATGSGGTGGGGIAGTPETLEPVTARTAAAPSRAPEGSLAPLQEMGAYEALWLAPGASFARLAELFRRHADALPSQFVSPLAAAATASRVLAAMSAAGVERFGVRVHGAGEYPLGLRDARHPVELLYFQGWWSLVESPAVAVVGTRQPTAAALRSARAIAAGLSGDGWTIASGLARGIDTAAHTGALAAGGRSIAVLGTPLTVRYPPENAALQRELAGQGLLVSQVPVLRHQESGWQLRRSFFPERNATLSALTRATIIVQAGDTAGTLHQARAALHQGRKLLLLESCFDVPGLSWPHRFERLGAVRVRDLDEIRGALGPAHQD
jgi:DNA processing protein